MAWSAYQEAVFEFARSSDGNAAINAVAGSGKTTTGVELCKLFDLYYGRFLAFNKSIADTLRARAPRNFECLTYNGFGYRLLPTCVLSMTKDRDYTKQFTRNPLWISTIERMVSLFKNMALMSVEEAMLRYDEIINFHDIEVPPGEGWYDLLFKVFKWSMETTNVISFDDQKYQPVRLGLAGSCSKCDVLIVDEFQDTCDIESRLILGCAERVFVFGDPDQCIYSFKGTTPNAMSVFGTAFKAVELPLSICYRCPTSVVAEAQIYVPRIEAAPGAAVGCVDKLRSAEFYRRVSTGDMVLGRVTVDLVTSCLRCIREGKPACVVGRAFGDMLLALYEKCPTLDALSTYFSEAASRLDPDSNRLQGLEDRVETLKVLMESGDVRERIRVLFDESAEKITHMTIHKAKGLETTGNVYLLNPQKIPHKRARKEHQLQEERRLMYVAITRATKGLYYVDLDH